MSVRYAYKTGSVASEANWLAAPLAGAMPCPFCGGSPAGKMDVSFWVMCADCAADGPGQDTPEEALALWNRGHHGRR